MMEYHPGPIANARRLERWKQLRQRLWLEEQAGPMLAVLEDLHRVFNFDAPVPDCAVLLGFASAKEISEIFGRAMDVMTAAKSG